MVSDSLAIKALPREILGKKVQALRRQNLLPGVLYGKAFAARPLSVNQEDFAKLFRQAGTSTIVTLELGDQAYDVLIKAVDFDPVTSRFLHVDFYQIPRGEKIRVLVPLRFTGEAPAVKELGGILVTNKKEVEIECLPKDLPHELEIALTPLVELEASLKVKDLRLPAGVEVLAEPDEIITVVTAPKAEEEEVPVSEAEAIAAISATAEKTEEIEATEEKNETEET